MTSFTLSLQGGWNVWNSVGGWNRTGDWTGNQLGNWKLALVKPPHQPLPHQPRSPGDSP